MYPTPEEALRFATQTAPDELAYMDKILRQVLPLLGTPPEYQLYQWLNLYPYQRRPIVAAYGELETVSQLTDEIHRQYWAQDVAPTTPPPVVIERMTSNDQTSDTSQSG